MKFSILPLALACTGLLTSASPLRVIIVSNGVHTPDNGPVAHLQPPPPPTILPGVKGADGASTNMQRVPCGGARFRQKVGSMTESLKIAFGFSVSNNNMKPVPPPTRPALTGINGPKSPIRLEPPVVHIMAPERPHRHGHGHRFHHHGEQPSFLMRVHFALMSLGPWEGRAVAFVLGCGIGVLLRMFWVMVVISYRMIKGPSSTSEQEHEYTVIDMDAEEIFVAPPTYTYPVEKAEPVEPVPVVVVSPPADAK
jgi:hypothetical protein